MIPVRNRTRPRSPPLFPDDLDQPSRSFLKRPRASEPSARSSRNSSPQAEQDRFNDDEADMANASIPELNALLATENILLEALIDRLNQSTRKIARISRMIEKKSQMNASAKSSPQASVVAAPETHLNLSPLKRNSNSISTKPRTVSPADAAPLPNRSIQNTQIRKPAHEPVVRQMQPLTLDEPRRPQRPAPPAAAAASASAPSTTDVSWELARLPYPEKLCMQTPKIVCKLERKPRSLLLPIAANSSLSDVAVTSHLGGQIHFVNLRSRSSMYTIDQQILRNGWAEDMCWVAPDVLAVASVPVERGKRPEARVEHQIALLYNCKIKHDGNQIGTLDFELHHLPNMPYEKGISTMEPMPFSGNKTQWLTAGLEHKICLWSYDGKFTDQGMPTVVNIKNIHTMHTNMINSIHFNSFSDVMYTGGTDGRLIGWSLKHERSVLSTIQRNFPMRDVLGIPKHPNLLLCSFLVKDNQMRLFDTRANQYVLNLTGGEDNTPPSVETPTSISRYMHASVHPNGFMVSIGENQSRKIDLWDLRYAQVHMPTQVIDIHSNRVVCAQFFESLGHSSLVTLSNDNTVAVTDYKRQAHL